MSGMTGRQDAPVLLLTKLHPPFVPAQAVARERLFARPGEGRGRRLSLVAGPAGFGKSTLLAAWRERELAHRPVAWVTLDGGDDDTVVLWSHIVEALCRACPGLAHEELAAAAAAAPLLEVTLPRLVNALLEQEDVVLVLDDFHRLGGGTARESVAWFVEHVPATHYKSNTVTEVKEFEGRTCCPPGRGGSRSPTTRSTGPSATRDSRAGCEAHPHRRPHGVDRGGRLAPADPPHVRSPPPQLSLRLGGPGAPADPPRGRGARPRPHRPPALWAPA